MKLYKYNCICPYCRANNRVEISSRCIGKKYQLECWMCSRKMDLAFLRREDVEMELERVNRIERNGEMRLFRERWIIYYE